MTTNERSDLKRLLEGRQEKLSWWFKISTAAVVAGLVIEYGPAIIKAIRAHTFPIELIGPLLITVGVAGELIVEFLATRNDSLLREINDAIIGELHDRAAKAETQLAPRNLTEDGRKELIEALEPNRGEIVDILLFDDHIEEVYRLYGNLTSAFLTAGWYPRGVWLSGGFRMHGAGVVLGTAKEGSLQERRNLELLASTIPSILGRSGIETSVSLAAFSIMDRVTLPTVPSSPQNGISATPAMFRVQIGEKVPIGPEAD